MDSKHQHHHDHGVDDDGKGHSPHKEQLFVSPFSMWPPEAFADNVETEPVQAPYELSFGEWSKLLGQKEEDSCDNFSFTATNNNNDNSFADKFQDIWKLDPKLTAPPKQKSWDNSSRADSELDDDLGSEADSENSKTRLKIAIEKPKRFRHYKALASSGNNSMSVPSLNGNKSGSSSTRRGSFDDALSDAGSSCSATLKNVVEAAAAPSIEEGKRRPVVAGTPIWILKSLSKNNNTTSNDDAYTNNSSNNNNSNDSNKTSSGNSNSNSDNNSNNGNGKQHVASPPTRQRVRPAMAARNRSLVTEGWQSADNKGEEPIVRIKPRLNNNNNNNNINVNSAREFFGVPAPIRNDQVDATVMSTLPF